MLSHSRVCAGSARHRGRTAGRIALVLLAALLGGAAAAREPAPPPSPAVAAPEPDKAPPAAVPAPPALQPCPRNAEGPSQPALPLGLARMIQARVHQRVGGEVSSVCRMPFGLYEVMVDSDIVYVDERVNYLVAGNAFDLRTQENLTARRKEEVFRVDVRTLPLQLAVKTVRGNGARQLFIFEDPNCPYCKRFEHDIATLTNTTIYTFLYPILSRDVTAADDSYPKAKAIWCAPDRTAAWSQVMLEGKHLDPAPDSCKHPLEDILALGQKLHVTGTPTILFADGRRAPGAIPLARVEEMMTAAAAPPGATPSR